MLVSAEYLPLISSTCMARLLNTRSTGLRLGDVDSFPSIDVTIDGADE